MRRLQLLKLKQLDFKKVRIGVDKENPQSNYFLKKNGFYIISKEKCKC